jgi:hypothetical protein
MAWPGQKGRSAVCQVVKFNNFKRKVEAKRSRRRDGEGFTYDNDDDSSLAPLGRIYDVSGLEWDPVQFSNALMSP